MTNVAAHIDTEVTPDGTSCRVERFGGAKHFPSHLDSVIALPNHGANRARTHILNQSCEEALLREISIVGLHVFLAWCT